ncbi:phage recombination protein Bet [Listeria kieliensis]
MTKETETRGVVKYEANGMEITLSPEIIRKNIEPKATDEEIFYFLALCKAEKLNPFVKEAYLVKYGNAPASMIIAKEAFMKRAESNEVYDGFEAGIIVERNNELVELKGGVKLSDDVIVGGWARVYRKDRKVPAEIEVAFDEYIQRKKDGSVNSMWTNKPATMIRKVALAQAMREAFPSSLNNIYTPEEVAEKEPKEVFHSKEEIQEFGKQKAERIRKEMEEANAKDDEVLEMEQQEPETSEAQNNVGLEF